MSPILRCFVFLMACCCNAILCNAHIACFPEERDALLSLKNVNELPSSVSWKGLNCCEWHGVLCSPRTSHVVQLHLSSSSTFSQLRGDSWEESRMEWLHSYEIYWDTHSCRSLSQAVFRLKNLEHLDLSFNCLTGAIPEGLSALTHLRHLDLSFNYFEGEIPKAMASLLNLTYLNLRFAGFNGTVPYQLGNLSHLEFLDLSTELTDWYDPAVGYSIGGEDMLTVTNLEWASNLLRLKHLSLRGVDLSMLGKRFGEHISHLRHLQYVDVAYCGLSGPIPIGFLNLTSLAHLFLGFNTFSSQIPSWLGNMTVLHSLWLNNNDFDGPFPLSLSRLPVLQDLVMDGIPLLSGDLSEILGGEWPLLSKFSILKSNVTGFLPSVVGNISSLTFLGLGHMAIEGSIPSSIGNLSALEYLSICHASLNGTIPASLGRLSSFRALYLQNNQLKGSIPSFEADINTIRLESNNLQGDVFLDSFQNYTHLRHLRLSHNEFTVHVNPQWIPKIYLEGLGLASCNIGGNLPVFLSTQYRLSYLDLSKNNLVGSIPSWFEELKDLQYLNLSYNHLEGHLPSNFNPTQYRSLALRSNSLSGPAPIPRVESDILLLDLSYNRFTGMIPKKIGMLLPEIVLLVCAMNDLTGGIPTSIGRLQQLEALDFSGNELKGRIPSSLTNCLALKILNLDNTSLTGQIPSDIGMLSQLESLHVNDNLVVGNLPESLLNCSELQILDVGKNLMSGNIPLWITRFSKMMILILRENQFQGCIPHELSNLSALHVLDISHNRLIGFIPTELGKLAAMVSEHVKTSNGSNKCCLYSEIADVNFYYKEQIQVTSKGMRLDISRIVLSLIISIDLSGNELSGKIPLEIGNLEGLHALNISRNNLSGGIPRTLGMMKQLESLDLSCNELHGRIPPDMLKLSFLAVLNVSHNRLHGKIPVGGQFSTFTATSFSGNSGLCGFPLNNTCESATASGISRAGEDEEEGGGGIPWHWYVEWMGSFAVGFWGVHGVVWVRRKWRRGFYGALDRMVARMDRMTVRMERKLRPCNAL